MRRDLVERGGTQERWVVLIGHIDGSRHGAGIEVNAHINALITVLLAVVQVGEYRLIHLIGDARARCVRIRYEGYHAAR